jgi:uncharacterized membrane protein
MRWIVRYFFQGLLIVVPVAVTVYVLYWVFSSLDNLVDAESWLGVALPGLGVVLTLGLVTAVGFLASAFFSSWILKLMDRLFQRMPVAKLIYSAIKDLLEAFVGEKKRFDRPVLVSLGDKRNAEVLGFITRDDLGWLDREGCVAVYFPQSYNFAGNLLIFPSDRVTPVEADSSAVMQFIVSGGVSGTKGQQRATCASAR